MEEKSSAVNNFNFTSPKYHHHHHPGNNSTNQPAARSKSFENFKRCIYKLLRNFQKAKFLLIILCISATSQSMAINGFVPNSITTLESRFQLSSSQSGLFSSAYDIAVLVVLLPVCHFGDKGHKGKWLSLGMLVMAFGSLICTLPHFISEPYEYSEGEQFEICRKNHSTASLFNVKSDEIFNKNAQPYFFYILLLGQVLHGIGAAPLYTLGVAYLDENVSQKMSPVYLGIYFAFATLGPALGFIIGGMLLNINGDIDKITQDQISINPDHPSWYGAWWIGFLITGMLSFLVSFPLNAQKYKNTRVNEANQHSIGSAAATLHFTGQIKDLPKLCLVLLKNFTYLLLVLRDVINSFLMNAFITFMPKIFQNAFSITAGSIVVPVGVFGNILGGYVIKWRKLRCRQTILLCTILEAIGTVLTFSFLIKCYRIKLAGIDSAYDQSSSDGILQMCNEECGCSNIYNPVCDEALGVTYFSACYAGCQDEGKTENASSAEKKVHIWQSCSCTVDYKNNTVASSVVQGACLQSCTVMYLFFVCFAFQIFVIFLSAMPSQQSMLRCVTFEQRTLALGLDYIFVRALGSVPGPILFGYILDAACEIWQGKKNDESCIWYNSFKLSTSTFIFGFLLKLSSTILLALAWKVYRSPADEEHSESNCESKEMK
ncbi:solute carrier organic anion transporter family member 4A1 [Trichinella spiralis]|uniref:solute carrier organic anion transporter family member 4A1 n=1 Tax=Trichinella spiralis TaxID=6334 RepID=UPI0001EFCE7F|nr:solute carrier organic anion transporter family member 4A1 [Trichinella spiralis]